MKIIVRLLFMLAIITPMLCQTMEAEEDGIPHFQITPATLAKHEATFKKFVQRVEQQDWPRLRDLLDPDTWSGWAITGAVNALYIPFSKKPTVRPREGRIFLGRVFGTPTTGPEYAIPPILQQGIDALKEGANSDYLAYVNGVLRRLCEDDLRKRDLARLAEAMAEEKKQYPDMPGTSNMSDKEAVPDRVFAPFAVAQLFTTCCIEERLLFAEKEKESRHPHSLSKKRHSKTLES